MFLKKSFGTFASLAVLVAIGYLPATAAVRQGPPSARAIALSREQNDLQMTDCSRWKSAYDRLREVKNELSKVQDSFAATDDIVPKLAELVTQTNDAMTTAQRRVRTCPARLQ